MGCILGWLCWHWFLRHKPVTSIIERRIDCKLKKSWENQRNLLESGQCRQRAITQELLGLVKMQPPHAAGSTCI